MFIPTWSSSLTTCATVGFTSGLVIITVTGNNADESNCSTNIIATYDTFSASGVLTLLPYPLLRSTLHPRNQKQVY